MTKVRIGFVGVGGMGQMAHLRNYVTLDDCEVVALAEVRRDTGRLVAQRYGIPKVYGDHREMLASERLDGIVASQPFDRHAVLLPDLYKGVEHLFTEKPLAVSPDAGRRLARAAARAKCIHMVGYHKRSDPATICARRTIDAWRASGEMGRLRYVRILMPAGDWIASGFVGLLSAGDAAPDLEREPPLRDMDKKTAREYVSFVNYYIHQVNLMRHLMGEPYKVAYAEKSGVLMAVESASGVAGTIEMTPYRTTVAWEESALVAFEKGYVALRLPAPLATHRAGSVEIYRDPGDGAPPERVVPEMPWVHAMRQQAMNFVKVCRGEMAPPCDAAEAAEDLKVARQY
ncbi:MAG: Gfo/Idh/MocA family oxidoreductase, partial [Planctomycetes bacterium]|nr:Gfo/Idh/MocA family oxidoreductase [Planctomycetota bacterium]